MSDTYDAALQAFQGLDESSESQNQPVGEQGGEVEPQSQPGEHLPASRDIDLSGLTEEQQIFLRAREREMQADYTRKTQEIAEQRREAEQAMQFLTALNSDPDFAFQVLNHLQSNLATAGYQVAPDEYEVDEYGEYEEPNPYEQEISELRQWKDQMQQEWLEANLAAQLDRQLSTIQAQHPDWSEQDMQAVVDLGYATNGDLMAASEQYQAMQDAILARYLEKKGSVNTPSPLPSSPAVTPPAQPKSEKELRSAAEEYLRARLS